jgi:glycine/D-amino acid oxidase-like deaminating enzyme
VVDWDASIPWLFWVAGLGGHGATASPAIGTSAAARIAVRLAPKWA